MSRVAMKRVHTFRMFVLPNFPTALAFGLSLKSAERGEGEQRPFSMQMT
jgi:hypothetical protein